MFLMYVDESGDSGLDNNDKPASYDVFTMAWKALIQRFENTIAHRNFRGPSNADERGMIFPDATGNKKLTRLLRQMRRYYFDRLEPALCKAASSRDPKGIVRL